MTSQLLYALPSPLVAHHNYLSVEERFLLFTLFTAFGVMGTHVLENGGACRIRSIM